MARFDIQGAREAGYTDEAIAQFLAEKQGFNYPAALEAGYQPTSIAEFLAEKLSAVSATPAPVDPVEQARMDVGGRDPSVPYGATQPENPQPFGAMGGQTPDQGKGLLSDDGPLSGDFWRGVSATGVAGTMRGVASLSETAQDLARDKASHTPELGAFSGISGITRAPEEIASRGDELGFLDPVIEGARDFAEIEEAIVKKNRPKDPVAAFAYDGFGSAGLMVPSILVGAVTKSPTLALSMMGIPAYGEGYEDAIKKGASKEKAQFDGFVSALFELGPEKLFNVFGVALGKKKAKNLIMDIIGREGGSEVLTEELNTAYDALVNGEDQGEFMDILGKFSYAGGQGIFMGGGIASTLGTAQSFDVKKQNQKAQDRFDEKLRINEYLRRNQATQDLEQAEWNEQRADEAREKIGELRNTLGDNWKVEGPVLGNIPSAPPPPEPEVFKGWGFGIPDHSINPNYIEEPPSDNVVQFLWDNLNQLEEAPVGVTFDAFKERLQGSVEGWYEAHSMVQEIAPKLQNERDVQAADNYAAERSARQSDLGGLLGQFGTEGDVAPPTASRASVRERAPLGGVRGRGETRPVRRHIEPAADRRSREPDTLPLEEAGVPPSPWEVKGSTRSPFDRGIYEPTPYVPGTVEKIEADIDAMSNDDLFALYEQIASDPTQARDMISQYKNGQGMWGTPEVKAELLEQIKERAKEDATWVERQVRDQGSTVDLTRAELIEQQERARGLSMKPTKQDLRPDVVDESGVTILSKEAKKAAKDIYKRMPVRKDGSTIQYGKKSKKSKWEIEGYDRENGVILLKHTIKNKRGTNYVRVWFDPFNNTTGKTTRKNKETGEVEWDRSEGTNKLLTADVRKYVPNDLREELRNYVEDYVNDEYKMGRPGGRYMVTISPSYVTPAPTMDEVTTKRTAAVLKQMRAELRDTPNAPTDQEIKRKFDEKLEKGEIDLQNFGIEEARAIVNEVRKDKRAEAPKLTPQQREEARGQARSEAIADFDVAVEVISDSILESGEDSVILDWAEAPKLKGDIDGTVQTIIGSAARNRIDGGVAIRERAYQVMANGLVRVLEIRATQPGKNYEVTVVSVGRNKVEPPKKIANIGPSVPTKIISEWVKDHPSPQAKGKITRALIEKLHEADRARSTRETPSGNEQTEAAPSEEEFVLSDPGMDRIINEITKRTKKKAAAKPPKKQRAGKIPAIAKSDRVDLIPLPKRKRTLEDKEIEGYIDDMLFRKGMDKLAEYVDNAVESAQADSEATSMDILVAEEEAVEAIAGEEVDNLTDSKKDLRDKRYEIMRDIQRRAAAKKEEEEVADALRERKIDSDIAADKRARALGRDGMRMAQELLNRLDQFGGVEAIRAVQKAKFDEDLNSSVVEAIVDGLMPYYQSDVRGTAVAQDPDAVLMGEKVKETDAYYEGDRFRLGTGGIKLTVKGEAQKAAVRRALDSYIKSASLPSDPNDAILELMAVREYLKEALIADPNLIGIKGLSPSEVRRIYKRVATPERIQAIPGKIKQAAKEADPKATALDIIQHVISETTSLDYYGPGGSPGGAGRQPLKATQEDQTTVFSNTKPELNSTRTIDVGTTRTTKSEVPLDRRTDDKGTGRVAEGTGLPANVVEGTALEQITKALSESINASMQAQLNELQSIREAVTSQPEDIVASMRRAGVQNPPPGPAAPTPQERRISDETRIGQRRQAARVAAVGERASQYEAERQQRIENARAQRTAARTPEGAGPSPELNRAYFGDNVNEEIAEMYGVTPQQLPLDLDIKQVEEIKEELRPVVKGYVEFMDEGAVGTTDAAYYDYWTEFNHYAPLKGGPAFNTTRGEKIGNNVPWNLSFERANALWLNSGKVDTTHKPGKDVPYIAMFDNVMPVENPPAQNAAQFTGSLGATAISPAMPITSTKGMPEWQVQLARLWTRHHGAGRKHSEILKLAELATGFVQYHNEQVMDQWALAQRAMGKKSEARDEATNLYLQGTGNLDSIERKTGYRISNDAIPHLDAIKGSIAALSAMGYANGAWQKKNVIGAIISNRAYLSRQLGTTKKTEKQVRRMMPQLVEFYEQAYPNITEEQLEKASSSKMLGIILHRMPHLADRFGHSTVDMGAFGGKEGTIVPTWNFIGEDGRSIPLVARTESGNFNTKQVFATDQQLRAIIRGANLGRQSGEESVWKIVEGILSAETKSLISQGKGATKSIQRGRNLLKSEREQIVAALWRIKRSSLDKGTREWLTKNYNRQLNMTMEEVMAEVAEKDPALVEKTKQYMAEYRLNDALRKALNEITDTSTILGATVEQMAESVAMTSFLTDVFRTLRDKGSASTTRSAGGADWVPIIDAGTKLGDSYLMLEATATDGTRATSKQAHEVFVPRQVARAIQDITGYGRELEKGASGFVFKWFRRAGSFAKYGKVVLNPLAHPRNLISTSFIHAVRGMFGYNAAYATTLATSLAWQQGKLGAGDYGRAKKADRMSPAQRRLEAEMLKHNLYFDGGKIGAVYDLRKQGFGARTGQTEQLHKFGRGWKNFRNFFDNAFRLEDEAVKAHALITYASDYMYLSGNDHALIRDYFEGKTLDEAQMKDVNRALKVAAEQVKNSYPTFSRTPEFIKMLSRSPILGAFPSFNAEMIRTSGHVMYQNMRLAAGYLPDGTRVAKNRMLQAATLATWRAGANVGLMTGAAAITNVLARGAMAQLDDDEEGLLLLLKILFDHNSDWVRSTRGLMTFWQRNTMTYITDVDRENRTYESVNVGYLSPYGAMNDVIGASQAAYRDAMDAGVGSPEWEAAEAFAAGLAGVYGSAEPLAGSIYKRWSRRPTKAQGSHHVKNFANMVDAALSEGLTPAGEAEGDLGNIAGAIVGGAIEAWTPEAFNQSLALWDIAYDMIDATPEDSLDDHIATTEVVQRVQTVTEAMGHVAGLKRRQHNWDEEFGKGMKVDRHTFSAFTAYVKDALLEPGLSDEEYTKKFTALHDARKIPFRTLSEKYKASSEIIGASVDDMVRADPKFSSVGGADINSLYFDNYSPVSGEDFYDYMQKQVEDERVDLTINQQNELLRQFESSYAQYLTNEQARKAPPKAEVEPKKAPPKEQRNDPLSSAYKDVRKDEGFRRSAYVESAGGTPTLTVGYGHKVLPEDGLKKGDTISKAKAEELFERDLGIAWQAARKVVPAFDEHPASVQRAVINMAFQLGESRFRKFKKTLQFLEEKDYEAAADEALNSVWAREQTPRRAQRVADMIRRAR